MGLLRNSNPLKIIGGVLKTPQVVSDVAVDAVVGSAKLAAKPIKGTKAGEKIKKSLNPLKEVRKKDGTLDQRWDNLWTGKRLSNVYGAPAAIGIAAFNMGQVGYEDVMRPMRVARENVEYGGKAEVLDYDGVASSQAPKNLNAHGDLVFGLHNSRRG